jgi:hypothetical protein
MIFLAITIFFEGAGDRKVWFLVLVGFTDPNMRFDSIRDTVRENFDLVLHCVQRFAEMIKS